MRKAQTILLATLAACGPASRQPTPDAPLDHSFTDPRCAAIRGYTGDAMEPFLTRDGRYLLFNTSNAPTAQTDIQVARVIDDLTFDYVGPLVGANSAALDGVPTVSSDGTLFFVSVRSYDATGATIYRGRFRDGVADRVALVDGLPRGPGLVHFDVEVSADGSTLYYARGIFDGGPVPKSADLAVAVGQGTSFVPSNALTAALGAVNTRGALEYAAAISPDGRELFFTRLSNGDQTGIYRTVRPNASAAFGAPGRIAAITGFVEAPTLSSDGQRLYYHQRVGDRFAVCRVRRATGT
jgi:WD40 repeat protein